MKKYAILLCSALLTACAATPSAPPLRPLFSDELFTAPSERIDAGDVFALSADMKRYVNVEIASQLRAKGPQQGLFDALYKKEQLRIEYDSAMTRNAVQTFEARSGNCLSLVIMTAAFAKEIGLPIEYNDVYVDETWRRDGDIYFSSGHVNLTLGHKLSELGRGYGRTQSMTIDFLPPPDIASQRTRTIEERTIVAMYMNNRAAESLARDKVNDAYWWAREAVRLDPRFLGSYNTLGVVYQRHGNLQLAERVFKQIIERAPENTLAMSNLTQVLNGLGHAPEAKILAQRLAQIQPYAPYHYFNLGMVAMRNGDFAAARALFAKDLARDPYNAEFEYWLGTAYYRLGDLKQADKHLAVALEYSTTRKEHDLYSAKLDRIRSYKTQ